MLSLETAKKDAILFPYWAPNMLLVWCYDVPFIWLFYKVLLSQVQGLASVKAKEEIVSHSQLFQKASQGWRASDLHGKISPFMWNQITFWLFPLLPPRRYLNLDRSLHPNSPTGSVLQNKVSWVLTFYFLLSGLSCPFFSWPGPLVGFEKLSRTSPGTQVYIDYKLIFISTSLHPNVWAISITTSYSLLGPVCSRSHGYRVIKWC